VITHDYCIVLLSAERTLVMQELEQVYREHTFCDPAIVKSNGVPLLQVGRPPGWVVVEQDYKISQD